MRWRVRFTAIALVAIVLACAVPSNHVVEAKSTTTTGEVEVEEEPRPRDHNSGTLAEAFAYAHNSAYTHAYESGRFRSSMPEPELPRPVEVPRPVQMPVPMLHPAPMPLPMLPSFGDGTTAHPPTTTVAARTESDNALLRATASSAQMTVNIAASTRLGTSTRLGRTLERLAGSTANDGRSEVTSELWNTDDETAAMWSMYDRTEMRSLYDRAAMVTAHDRAAMTNNGRAAPAGTMYDMTTLMMADHDRTAGSTEAGRLFPGGVIQRERVRRAVPVAVPPPPPQLRRAVSSSTSEEDVELEQLEWSAAEMTPRALYLEASRILYPSRHDYDNPAEMDIIAHEFFALFRTHRNLLSSLDVNRLAVKAILRGCQSCFGTLLRTGLVEIRVQTWHEEPERLHEMGRRFVGAVNRMLTHGRRDVHAVDDHRQTMEMGQHTFDASLLLDYISSDDGGTALELALRAENRLIVRMLLDAGADPNQPQRATGIRPLHMLASKAHMDARTLFPYLLEAGANPSLCAPGGWTVLHEAAQVGNVRFLQAMFSQFGHGVTLGVVDHVGRTPYDVALAAGQVTLLMALAGRGGLGSTLNEVD